MQSLQTFAGQKLTSASLHYGWSTVLKYGIVYCAVTACLDRQDEWPAK